MSLKSFIENNREKIKNIINTNVDNQSYRLAVIGRSGSGKSYWVRNFLSIETKHKNVAVFVITPPHNKEFYSKITNNIFTEVSINSVLYSIEIVLKFAEQFKNSFRTILIFDDIISEKIVNDDAFKQLFATARHYNVNIIFIIQAYTRVITPFMKDQLTHYLLFALNNPRVERQIIYDLIAPMCGDISKSEKQLMDDAIKIYNDNIINKKYGNILIDYNNHELLM